MTDPPLNGAANSWPQVVFYSLILHSENPTLWAGVQSPLYLATSLQHYAFFTL